MTPLPARSGEGEGVRVTMNLEEPMDAPLLADSLSNPVAGHLLVRVGEQICAVPVAAVRRVVRALTVHPLPGARPELSGLAEFGGEPLPVLDLGRLIGAPIGPHPLFPVTLVVWSRTPDGRETIGLAADEALEVVDLSAASWLPAAGFLIGEALVGDTIVRVLDPDQLGGTA